MPSAGRRTRSIRANNRSWIPFGGKTATKTRTTTAFEGSAHRLGKPGQQAAHEVERGGHAAIADQAARPGEAKMTMPLAFGSEARDVDRAHGLVRRAARGAGDAGHADAHFGAAHLGHTTR